MFERVAFGGVAFAVEQRKEGRKLTASYGLFPWLCHYHCLFFSYSITHLQSSVFAVDIIMYLIEGCLGGTHGSGSTGHTTEHWGDRRVSGPVHHRSGQERGARVGTLWDLGGRFTVRCSVLFSFGFVSVLGTRSGSRSVRGTLRIGVLGAWLTYFRLLIYCSCWYVLFETSCIGI